jgi:hypothetical protein
MKQFTLIVTLFSIGSLAGVLAGCIEVGLMSPLDEAARSIGSPKIEIALHQSAHGAVGVTMPDGEILRGEYEILENASIAATPSGQFAPTGLPLGSRHVVARATGVQTTMSCDGLTDGKGHGSATCGMSNGAHYLLQF